jgi:hypothetical protein
MAKVQNAPHLTPPRKPCLAKRSSNSTKRSTTTKRLVTTPQTQIISIEPQKPSTILSPKLAKTKRVANKSITCNDYQIIHQLAHGGSARIYLTRHKKKGLYYAAKVFRKCEMNLYITSQIKKERDILKGLDFWLIIKLENVMKFENEVWFILEFGNGGSLQNLLYSADGKGFFTLKFQGWT